MSEDTQVFLEEWRLHVHPRRGGGVVVPAEPDPDAVALIDDLTRTDLPRIEDVLASEYTEPALAGRVRAWLRGEADPVGAAATASILAIEPPSKRDAAHAPFADAWAAEYGLPFAACAFTELCGVYFGWPWMRRWNRDPDITVPQDRGPTRGIMAAAPGDSVNWWWGDGDGPTLMRRMRTLLAAASDRDHQATVDRLATHRTDDPRRRATAYLVPARQDWVDECGSALDGEWEWSVSRKQLLCSLGTAAQVAEFLQGRGTLGWGDAGSKEIVATLVDGLGTAAVPLMEHALRHSYTPRKAVRRTMPFQALLALPSSKAFQGLVDQITDKDVLPVLRAAVERYPVRAMRLLAPVAAGETTAGLVAAGLLSTRVRADPGVVPDGLPFAVRKVVEQFLRPAVPVTDELPRVLTDPPWIGERAKPKPLVVTGLAPPAERRMVWEPGEREKWTGTLPEWARDDEVVDWGQVVEHHLSGLPVPAGFWLRPAVARFGVDVLPQALRICVRSPVLYGDALLPYLDAEVARVMADWLARLQAARGIARRWFQRHGTAAVPFLVPAAFTKPGPERRNAEAALRLLATQHGQEAVIEAAGESARSVRALLTLDPLEILPARVPDTGWADPARLPQVLLRDRRRALPAAATAHLLTMLAMAKPGEVYAGVGTVRELCDPASLAEFSWAVFLYWQANGAPTDDGWALVQLGLLGDDTTARRIAPAIRAWPGEQGTSKAVTGLEVLAEIGSDVALTHLCGIARKTRFKGLKAKAQRKVEEVAAARGLTAEQLADRAVPDFGLDADGGLELDYGPRRFRVGFDEQLRPFVTGGDGKVRKSPPKPGPADDPTLAPAAHALFTGLRKDLKTIAEDEVRRLERAMLTGRRWTPAEFTSLFVGHPLLWHIVRRLVWLAEDGTGHTPFRVAEDRSFADVDDDAFTLPDGTLIGIAHPLFLGEALGGWSELFADYEILQPFPQVGRPVHTLTEDERGSVHLERFEGRTAPYGNVWGLAWGRWRGDGEPFRESWMARADPSGRCVVVTLSPGLHHYAGQGDEQTFTAVRAGAAATPERSPKDTVTLGDIDPVTMSEVIYDLTRACEG